MQVSKLNSLGQVLFDLHHKYTLQENKLKLLFTHYV